MVFKREMVSFALVLALAFPPGLAASALEQGRRDSIVVPRDTVLKLVLDDHISTKTAEVGDDFEAVVAEDVKVNGVVAIPQGAVVEGEVTRVEDAERLAGLRGQANLMLGFNRLRTGGRSYSMDATLVSVHDPVRGLDSDDVRDVGREGEIEAKTDTGDIITRGAIGVAAGALLGALFGNVSRGLLLGSIGGAVAILAPKGEEVELQDGTGVRIRLDRDLNMVTT